MATLRRPESWATLVVLLLVAANLRPALASLGPVLELLRTDLHLTRAQAGYLGSLPIICMGLFAPFTLRLQHHLGAKNSVLLALLGTAAGTSLRLMDSFTAQLVSAVMVGCGVAVLGPLLSAYIKLAYGPKSGRISAWTTTALCLGAAGAAALSADLANLWNWNTSLASFSVPGWLAAGIWWYSAPALPTPTAVTTLSPWRSLRGWMLMLCFGTNSLVFYALLAWLAPLLVDAGLTDLQAGRLLGWFALLQIVGTMAVVMGARQQTDRRPGLWLFGTLTLIGLIGLWREPLDWAHLWLALLGMGTAGLFALTLILPLDFSQRANETAGWTVMMNCGGYLIAALGPYLCGLLRDATNSYSAPLLLLCVATVLAMLCGTLLRPAQSHATNN